MHIAESSTGEDKSGEDANKDVQSFCHANNGLKFVEENIFPCSNNEEINQVVQHVGRYIGTT